jgi:hypothetical protein
MLAYGAGMSGIEMMENAGFTSKPAGLLGDVATLPGDVC